MASFLELTIERAVAGGRMLARHEGQVVFVQGAIPGERVRARIERRQKQVLFAEAVEVREASPDRREPHCDLACGGSAYAHINYERQRRLKADIIADAFARIAKRPLDAPVDVAASPEAGYRMRSRVHVQQGRWGFYREGTHVMCDAAPTRQLRPDTCAAIESFLAARPAIADRLAAITVSENIDASARVLQLEIRENARRLNVIDDGDNVGEGVHGVTSIDGPVLWGAAWVEDTARSIWATWEGGAPIDADITWRRRPASFFQGNRYLLGALVSEVLRASDGARRVIDLYAGGGLFSVALAARGAHVVSVEMDGSSTRDLTDNAKPFGERLVPLVSPVEAILKQRPPFTADTIVMDPPRVGATPEAIAGLVTWNAPRIVYVSCDPPTLARDCAKLFAAGYRLTSLQGFDLFPNTAHVEAVAVLER